MSMRDLFQWTVLDPTQEPAVKRPSTRTYYFDLKLHYIWDQGFEDAFNGVDNAAYFSDRPLDAYLQGHNEGEAYRLRERPTRVSSYNV